MATTHVGYSWIIERFSLRAREPATYAVVDSALKRRTSVQMGYRQRLGFETKYYPGDSLVDHLQFALRYEGVDLEVLSLLFAHHGAHEIEAWISASPESAYARRAGFLHEWLTQKPLDASAIEKSKSRYVRILDDELQFSLSKGVRNEKFRVENNLPGNPRFCPLVRKTEELQRLTSMNLAEAAKEVLSKYSPDLIRRAASYLYMKETRSSFEIEHEHPPQNRAERFAKLLRDAQQPKPLTEKRLLDLQNAVIDPRYREVSYRTTQNWLGSDNGLAAHADFVPPRAEDVRDLMEGLAEKYESWKRDTSTLDPVVQAALIAFGFVFIHPFIDGNGRIHRFLIHEALSAARFTPPGLIFPVSAVMLANMEEYKDSLERFSQPLRQMTDFNPSTPDIPAKGNDAIYFRFFDATEQAAFLYRAIERTIRIDLEAEVDYLLAFDIARRELHAVADWPGQTADHFITFVHENGGTLSRNKRKRHFILLTDEEIVKFEAVVRDAFESVGKQSPR